MLRIQTSKVNWYVNRLRSMQPAELIHRAREVVAHKAYRYKKPNVISSGKVHTVSQGALASVFEEWLAGIPGIADYWEARGAMLTRGTIDVMGQEWPTEAGFPIWRADPFSDEQWPDDYTFDSSYKDRISGGDVSYNWELNRLSYLVAPAADAAVRNDEALGRLCASHLENWIESNKPYHGVAWATSIECALRVLYMLTIVDLIPKAFSESQLEKIHRSITIQIDWIMRFPSKYSSANNHRIAELSGVLLALCYLPKLTGDDLLDNLATELWIQVQQQFHPDGVSSEQSPSYAWFSLEWVGLVVRSLPIANQPSGMVWGQIRNAYDFLQNITGENGSRFHFGDEGHDLGLFASTLPEENRLECLGILLQIHDDVALLPGLKTYAAGGYSIVRGQFGGVEVHFLMDHGPLGHGNLAAHGHADTLSIWLRYDGRSILDEAGTYSYHTSGDWRTYFRSSTSHNTVTLAGQDSSKMSGPFNWLPKARARGRLISSSANSESWSIHASHDGYRRLGVTVHREVRQVQPGVFEIRDWLVGPATQATVNYLFAPDLDLIPTSGGWLVLSDSKSLCSIEIEGAFDARAVRGEEGPKQGWCSPRFGELEPAWQLRLTGALSAESHLLVRLSLNSSEAIAGPRSV